MNQEQVETGDKKIENIILKKEGLQLTEVAPFCHLSVQVFPASIQLNVMSIEDNTCLYFELIPNSLDILNQSEALNILTYKSSNITFFTPRETLVPFSIFDSSQVESFLKLNFGDVYNPSFEKQNKYEIATVFDIVDVKILNLIRQKHPSIEQHSMVNVFLNSLKEGMNIQFIDSKYFYMALLHNGKISYFNIFEYPHEDDALYYILSVLQGLKIDVKDQKFLFHGEIDLTSDLFLLLTRYIPAVNIEFPSIFNKGIKFASTLYMLSRHKYYSLFNQYYENNRR